MTWNGAWNGRQLGARLRVAMVQRRASAGALMTAAAASLVAIGAAVGSAGWPASAAAQAAPPLRIVVPFPPGGAADVFARLVGQKLGEVESGLKVVVENRPGAGGVLGTDVVAKATADGNTLLMVTVGHAVNPFIFSKLPYDTKAAFVPVGLVATVPSLVVTGAESPLKSLQDLLAAAKARPGALEYGSSGTGSTSHVSAALIESMTGVEMLHVPYKGAAAALQDVIGGRIAMSVDIITSSMAMVKANKLQALAITGDRRSPLMPDVPTVSEAGIPGYAFTSWYLLLAPAKTPAATVEKLNAALGRVERLPEFRARLADVGGEAASLDAKATAAYLDAEFVKWQQVVKARGIKAD